MKEAWKALGMAIKVFFMWVLHIVATPFIAAFKAIASGFGYMADKLEAATNPVKKG